MEVAAEAESAEDIPRPSIHPSTWLQRPLMESDESGMHYVLGVSYTRSHAGQRAGADGAGDTSPNRHNTPEAVILRRQEFLKEHMGSWHPDPVVRQKAFLQAHSPIWSWLLKNADVTLVVDPDEPQIIWGWLITSGPVIHAVGCKRSFCERIKGDVPISVDLVSDLLGDRLTRHQVCSLELPQMRSRGSGTIGIDRPREWSMDPTWLATRMGVR